LCFLCIYIVVHVAFWWWYHSHVVNIKRSCRREAARRAVSWNLVNM